MAQSCKCKGLSRTGGTGGLVFSDANILAGWASDLLFYPSFLAASDITGLILEKEIELISVAGANQVLVETLRTSVRFLTTLIRP
jgi:hypothetical protein